MKAEIEKIKIFKYIGETGKSCYERGYQHLSDMQQLKPSSHLLKHLLNWYEGEDFEKIEFGMRIRSTAKSAFERQVTESVLIQQESQDHIILNSKSEYNRCALPRLTTKLGEKEFEEMKKEEDEEKRKEEDLERKIRILRKQRNGDRKEKLRREQKDPLPSEKRRKISMTQFKNVKQMLVGWKKEEKELDKVEEERGRS